MRLWKQCEEVVGGRSGRCGTGLGRVVGLGGRGDSEGLWED